MTVQAPPSSERRTPRLPAAALAVYLVLLVAVLLSPTSVVQSALVQALVDRASLLGLEGLVTFARAEVVMNIVIVVPAAFLGAVVLPRLRWQDWTAYGFVGAIGVELLQGLVLPGREASFSDVVANASGALLGALLARLLLRGRGRR